MFDAMGSLVEINREVAKGDAANPVLVASAEPLCKVYHDHLIALGRLRLGAVMCAYSGAASSRSRLELRETCRGFHH
jgi:hypothetical protein